MTQSTGSHATISQYKYFWRMMPDCTSRHNGCCDADGKRLTLGITINERGNKARWDQHYGKCNSAVSARVKAAGKKLVTAYNRALLAAPASS